jgi:uracil-DNA glycosylase family 4
MKGELAGKAKKYMTWEQLESNCRECRRCGLAYGRTNVVIGRGCKTAPVMIVGEGPGQKEDETGLPFVGRAGELLDLALESLGFSENDYYIANIVKCRPENNRTPTEDECEKCLPYLRAQFALIRPKIIVCLGNVATKAMIDKSFQVSKARGIWYTKNGTLFLATYHPAALLRDESKKIEMWEDLRKVKIRLYEGLDT